jgi:predicted porin
VNKTYIFGVETWFERIEAAECHFKTTNTKLAASKRYAAIKFCFARKLRSIEGDFMKLKGLAIATLVLFTGAAHAQSSVTLYGLIDASVAYTNSVNTGTAIKAGTNAGGSEYQMMSGLLSTSRWGVRGSEDLGGGLHAVFQLENGFTVNNGALKNSVAGNVPDLFGRQAWVGLSSDQFGSVTLGRQYDFIADYVAPQSATGTGWGGNVAAHPFDNDDMDNSMRLNNSIKFSSATFAGIKVGAMYAFSNAAGASGNDNAYSVGAHYVYGGLTVAAAYDQINRNNGAPNTAGATSTTDGNYLSLGGDQQIYSVSAGYQFANKASIGVVWSHSATDNLGNGTGASLYGNSYALTGSSLKFDNFEINGRYFVRPDFSLGASYTYTMGAFSGGSTGPAADPHWNNFVVQADYQFSARTDLYAQAVYQLVGGGNGNSIFNAGVYGMTQSSTNKQLVTAIGLRHRF